MLNNFLGLFAILLLMGSYGKAQMAAPSAKSADVVASTPTATPTVTPNPDSVSNETEEDEGSTPPSLEDESEEPIVAVPQINQTNEPQVGRPWHKTDFSKQEGIRGYNPNPFIVPLGLEARVQFWVNIYSKLTTHQGLLHDAEYFNNIYEQMDFSDIYQREDLNPVQKEKLCKKRIKTEKEKYKKILLKLAHYKGKSEDLSADELRVWKMYENIDEHNKFSEAAGKKRLRFQLGQSDRFEKAIFYSGRYIEEMEKIFAEQGLPKELVRLVFVESSFNVFARSRVGASGLWQIMKSAGRRQLKINRAVDERNHPLLATAVAAKILKGNYDFLQSWPLAVMAYNHGPSGVAKLVKKMGTKDIVQLIEFGEKKRFRFASKNFYASFLAALEVEQNADKYFPLVRWDFPFEKNDIRVTSPMKYDVVLKWFDGDKEKADLFNPHLTKRVRTKRVLIPKGTLIHTPISSKDTKNTAVN